jgi:C4-dicarboxylate-specific signal transduction histidine kinase
MADEAEGSAPADERASGAGAAELWWIAAGIVHDIGNVLMCLRADALTIDGRLASVGADIVAHTGAPGGFLRGRVEECRATAHAFITGLDTLGSQVTDLRRLYSSASARMAHGTADLRRAIARTTLLARGRLALPVEVAGPPVVPVVGDEDAIVRVLLNLVLNATEALAGARDGQVAIRIQHSRGRVECDVVDNGPGVSAEALSRLFMTGGRVVGEEGGADRRRGLGLAVSRALMRQMGGDLQLLCTGPQGSTFRVTLRPAESP